MVTTFSLENEIPAQYGYSIHLSFQQPCPDNHPIEVILENGDRNMSAWVTIDAAKELIQRLTEAIQALEHSPLPGWVPED